MLELVTLLEDLLLEGLDLDLEIVILDLKLEETLFLLVLLLNGDELLGSHFFGDGLGFFDSFFKDEVLLLTSVVLPVFGGNCVKIGSFLFFESFLKQRICDLKLIFPLFQSIDLFVKGLLDFLCIFLLIGFFLHKAITIQFDFLVFVLKCVDPLLNFLKLERVCMTLELIFRSFRALTWGKAFSFAHESLDLLTLYLIRHTKAFLLLLKGSDPLCQRLHLSLKFILCLLRLRQLGLQLHNKSLISLRHFLQSSLEILLTLCLLHFHLSKQLLELVNLFIPTLKLQLVVVLLLHQQLGQLPTVLARLIVHDGVRLLAFFLQCGELLPQFLVLGCELLNLRFELAAEDLAIIQL